MQGVTSNVPEMEGYHYILLDFDDMEYYKAVDTLEKLIIKYRYINGFVMFSDKVNSYRVFSDTTVNFKDLLRIMLDAEGLDRMFFRWTVIRGYATIRVSGKKGRVKDKIIGVVGKPNMKFVKEKLKFIEYETDE
jgi:hypothetical protein